VQYNENFAHIMDKTFLAVHFLRNFDPMRRCKVIHFTQL
jgi:hypothetical protein